jgi:hypothetical protein
MSAKNMSGPSLQQPCGCPQGECHYRKGQPLPCGAYLAVQQHQDQRGWRGWEWTRAGWRKIREGDNHAR